MKKTSFVLLAITLVFLCACGSAEKPAETPAPVITEAPVPEVPKETLSAIEHDLKRAAIDDVLVSVRSVEGKVKVSVHLDPAVLKYMLALDMEPTILKLKDDLSIYEAELYEYKISASFYKGGKVDNVMSWTSSDLETGDFMSPMDGVIKPMTVEDVYKYCEYTPGEYEKMKD